MKEKQAKYLIRTINKALGVDITDRNRRHIYTFGRYVYFYYAKHYIKLTLNEMGAICGSRDHATALNGIMKYDELSKNKKFITIHDRCVKAINKTKRFPFVDLLYNGEEVVLKKPDEYVYKKNQVKQVIQNAFLSNGITNDIMEMTKDEIQEMISLKVKPHILMLRSRKKQVQP